METKTTKNNKLYSYTTITEMEASFNSSPGWLRIKQGLTIEQEIDERVKQQDNASSTSAPIVLSRLVVPNNDDNKLDDKVRKLQHKTLEFMHYERPYEINKKHEWSLVKISDIVDNFDNVLNEYTLSPNKITFLMTHFLNNKEFMDKLEDRIFNSKKVAVNQLLGTDSYTDIILRPWQEEIKNNMLLADKKYNLLSVAPRAGKTFIILDYAKEYASKNNIDNLVLLAASKNKSSNTSFTNDYRKGGYHIHGGFDIVDNGSLFQDDVNLIKLLKEYIPENSSVILVTDEADIASHTEISQEKLALITNEFNVVKQIAMSGTGIYKAAKIFKNISSSDIFNTTINYTEMLSYGATELVRRNFYGVKYDMDDMVKSVRDELLTNGEDINSEKSLNKMKIFNITQSFNQVSAFKTLSSYVRNFVDDEIVITSLNLKDSDVIMVFTPSKTKKNINNFVETFNKVNPDIATLTLTGDDTCNALAEELVKDKIITMKKLNDTRKLVIFSMAMGSRSFSVPEIRRVLIFGDGEINAPWYQKSARCLTYDFSKKLSTPIQEADIVRISFEEYNIAAETFLVENPVVDRSEETLRAMELQLKHNNFMDVSFNTNGLKISHNYSKNAAATVVDAALKYTDTTKYIMTRIVGAIVDKELAKKLTHKTSNVSSVSLTIPTPKINGGINTSVPSKVIDVSKITTAEEKALEVYVNILRILPYLAESLNYTYLEFIECDWTDFVIIPKEEFLLNMENDDFRETVEMMFRNVDKTDIKIAEKLGDYLNLAQ
jgi:hypothetical protein